MDNNSEVAALGTISSYNKRPRPINDDDNGPNPKKIRRDYNKHQDIDDFFKEQKKWMKLRISKITQRIEFI